MNHALTIDVEEFFQIHALSRVVAPHQWDHYPSTVEENTDRILHLLEDRGIKATFFCLGWVAERHKALIRRMHAVGHEVACHGYAHQVIYQQDPQAFKEDVTKAKAILEEITGETIIGYRAPTFSLMKKTLWTLDILEELGFQYDSSIFPIRHDNYGIPDSPRFPYRLENHALVEFPLSTVRIGWTNLPIAGGGYFRLFPYLITKCVLTLLTRESLPCIFYIHPWEFNPSLPRVASLSMLWRFRTYVGLKRTEERFSRLIAEFAFTTVRDVLKTLGLL